MNASQAQPVAGILAPLDERTLEMLSVANGFTVTANGDPGRITAKLRERVGREDSRVAVAVAAGARLVGFLAARYPDSDSRMYNVEPAIELDSFEVAGPERSHGLFTAMFGALFRRDLESRIVYVVADPSLRDRHESVRGFRERMASVLGSAGFVPMPTDDVTMHPSVHAALFVRIGRGVPQLDVEEFFTRLRSSADASVAISLKGSVLRTYLREDLERCGFQVRSVSAVGSTDPAEILITDDGGTPGRLLTVRLHNSVDVRWHDGALWYPFNELDKLGGVLRAEIERRRQHA